MRRFVRRLPSDHRWVVELRDRAFFDGGPAHQAVDELLADAKVGRVVLDTRPLYSAPPRSDAAVDEQRTKPRLPIVTDLMGSDPIVRVIGCDDIGTTVAGALEWVPAIVDWLAEGRRPYLFVHQPENLVSPELARRVHGVVAEQVPELAPLPTPSPVTPAGEVTGQSQLF